MTNTPQNSMEEKAIVELRKTDWYKHQAPSSQVFIEGLITTALAKARERVLKIVAEVENNLTLDEINNGYKVLTTIKNKIEEGGV